MSIDKNIGSFHEISKAMNPESFHPFNIKVNSLCIFGQDMATSIRDFKPNREIIFQAFNLHKHIDFYITQVSKKPVKYLKDQCSWITRRIVRSGSELVMERSHKYTRDLYPAYLTFEQFYPEEAPQMWQALEWGIDPIEDFTEVRKYVEDFGGWLCEEIARCFPSQ